MGIAYSDAYKEIDACVEAGMDYNKWYHGEYDTQVMANVLVWYDMKHLMEAHVSDEEAKQMKKKNKK